MTEQIYRSKKGLLIYFCLILISGFTLACIMSGETIAIILTSAMLTLVFLPMFFNTVYTIKGDGILNVKCGLIININIDINKIKSIRPTDSILSSPALSFDRIEIFYNKYDSVIVSPENKDEFVKALRELNPHFEYQNKI